MQLGNKGPNGARILESPSDSIAVEIFDWLQDLQGTETPLSPRVQNSLVSQGTSLKSKSIDCVPYTVHQCS